MSIAATRATLSDLSKVSDKAELIDGRIVPLMPTGYRPNRVAARIFRSLDDFSESTGRGFACTDNIGFAVPELSTGRESFSPDASYSLGPPPKDEMDFVEGPPLLAVEVRSDGDYSPAAERALADKRAEHFEAGTAIVWDVDPIANVIRSYRADSPDVPTTFVAGDAARAEPEIAGWKLDVNQVFRP